MQRLTYAVFALLLVVASANSVFADEKPANAGAQRQEILNLLTKLETGFAEGNAKALADCWAENGEFAGPAGARTVGRESIEKLFGEAFAARKEASKLQIHLNHLRLVNEGLALIEAVAEVKPAGAFGGMPLADFVLVKSNGRWQIESLHATIAYAPPQTNHLKELAWLVGDWSSAASKEGITLHSVCDWTANQAFLIRKFKVEGKEAILRDGTEIIGWDPRSNRIRSWSFDSDGGFGESVWVQDGNQWLIKYSGTLPDGSEASATHVLTAVDASACVMQSKDRVVNGAAQPDIPKMVLKRQAEAKPTRKAEETAKPAEKATP
jgi:uncharacterized protein (TIGR02246 family)